MKKHLPLLLVIFVFVSLSCHMRRIDSARNNTRDINDSIEIRYNVIPDHIIFSFYSSYYEYFLRDYNPSNYEYGRSLVLHDKSDIEQVAQAAEHLVKVNYSAWNKNIDTRYVLLFYHGSTITDTIALAFHPGEVQTRPEKYVDKISRDSLLWFTTMEVLAKKDRVWLNTHAGQYYISITEQ